MEFSIIAAIDEERGIGRSGRLPWRLSGDLKRFRALTQGVASAPHLNAVIMGRGTWDSLPERFRPLPNRLNIVLSRNPGFSPKGEGVAVARSFEEALKRAQGAPGAFIIGGTAVFAAAMAHPGCRRVYLTRVHGRFHCDAYLPALPSGLVRTERSDVHEEGKVRYHFETYER